MAERDVVRVAAVGDLHYGRTSQGTLLSLFAEVNARADLLLLAGDLTDYGTPDEAHNLAKELTASVRVPIVAVLGNHDFESGHPDEVRDIFCESGVNMLDGETFEVDGVGIAGIKGFAGGFGRGTLGFWGEPAIKRFVQEAIDEALKLEVALARLRTERKIALLHYAPIVATVATEPTEILPFLGTSRLEEPLLRYPVDAVIHGHAHNGAPEGKTAGGIPVYNVSLGLMQRIAPDGPPFRLLELPITAAVAPVGE
jgi:Icc-related predicted phosphoesterase